MKKFPIAIAAASVFVAGVAVAQPMPHRAWDSSAFLRGAPDSPRERIQFLQDRINRAATDGSLNRREAQRANRELNNIRQWVRRMHYDDASRRLTPSQRAEVQARLDRLSSQIRWMRHNGW